MNILQRVALLCAAFAAWLAVSFALPVRWAAPAGLALGYLFPLVWLRDRIALRRRLTFTALPFMLGGYIHIVLRKGGTAAG